MTKNNFMVEEQFFHHFQPIFDLSSNNKLGYEALLRSEKYSNPQMIFNQALKENKLYDLDSRSIHKAISTYDSAGFTKKEGILFVNVIPSTISNPNFQTFLNQIIINYSIKRQEKTFYKHKIVLEISESETIDDFEAFRSNIKEIKDLGFLIAIDDIGVGNANFHYILELSPDFLKLDRYFAENLSLSKNKQEFIKFFQYYCIEINCNLILEGIETERDLTCAKNLGIEFGQGYKLGKPDLLKTIKFGITV